MLIWNLEGCPERNLNFGNKPLALVFMSVPQLSLGKTDQTVWWWTCVVNISSNDDEMEVKLGLVRSYKLAGKCNSDLKQIVCFLSIRNSFLIVVSICLNKVTKVQCIHQIVCFLLIRHQHIHFVNFAEFRVQVMKHSIMILQFLKVWTMRDFLFICKASSSNLNSNNVTVQHLRSSEESQIFIFNTEVAIAMVERVLSAYCWQF